MNQRKIAYNIIYKTISDNSFTNLLMRKELDKLEPIQRPFVKNLVNGVLKNYESLIFNVELYAKKGSLKNKLLIAMGFYEIFMLNKEKFAVVNEYVNLADSQYTKGFINSILRNATEFKQSNDLSIKNNLPEWMYKLLANQYDSNELETILGNYQRIPEIYYHINQRKANIKQLKGIKVINDKMFISDNNLINTDDFNNGLYYIQDINASKLIEELNLSQSDTFIDICSAPGSKLFNALDYIDENNAYANDLYGQRVDLIRKKAEILGYKNIHYLNIDASEIGDKLDLKFDKMLLDVPCSGLGVIGRKPDIKFHITPESLDELQILQAKILESSHKLLKDNGLMLYSTCTLNKKENRKQIDAFLNKHQDFMFISDSTIINMDGDMFYHCLIKKV